jgi:hypothetical protein
MVQNIDSILARGERIELLVDKTDTMAGQAYAFRRGARGEFVSCMERWTASDRCSVIGMEYLAYSHDEHFSSSLEG